MPVRILMRRMEMLWVGDGDHRPLLKSVRGPDNLDQRFLSSVQYDAIPAVYQQAGILFCPR